VLLATKRRAPQGGDDVVRFVLRNVDERELLRNVDRADSPRVDARLIRDRADDVLRTDAAAPAQPDEQSRRLALAATSAITRRALGRASFLGTRALSRLCGQRSKLAFRWRVLSLAMVILWRALRARGRRFVPLEIFDRLRVGA